MGLLLCGGGAALLVFGTRSANPAPAALLCAAVALGALGAYLLLGGVRTRVVLTADAIESYGAFKVQRLARSDIAGRRVLRLNYGQSVTQLIPREPGMKMLKLSTSSLKTDAALDAWLREIPDLDVQEAEAAQAEIASDPELGQTPAERLARLARAKKLAGAFNTLTWVAAMWGFLYPVPYAAAVLVAAILPWAALLLVAKSGGLYRLDARRNDVRPNLAVAMYLPGFVLLMRAVQDLGVLDWQRALTYGALAALVLCWAALMCDPTLRARRAAALLLFGLMCAYGYGAVVLGNAELDSAPGGDYRVQVLGMHYSRGSRSTSYYLRLAPWGPRLQPQDVSVARVLYAATRPGDTVCVHQGPGVLGISWYVVRSCR
jgi:hypothetical protein